MINHHMARQSEVRARELRLLLCRTNGHSWDEGFFGKEKRCQRCGECSPPELDEYGETRVRSASEL